MLRVPTSLLSAIILVAVFAYSATPAQAGEVVLKDPKGDDNGPGNYKYPTAPEYTSGSFDLREIVVEDTGSEIKVKAKFAARIEDPWKSKKWKGNGFSLQMVFLFIDTDHKAGSGHAAALPGLNVNFEESSRWEKALIISPQGNARLKNELNSKVTDKVRKDVVLPTSVKVNGRTIVAVFPKSAVGAPSAAWGYQALVQSNEGYPDRKHLLTRKVMEYKGQHKFGGGHDYDCDPHVLDMLAGSAKGDSSEKAAQHKALKGFKCDDDNPDGGTWTRIPMVYPGR